MKHSASIVSILATAALLSGCGEQAVYTGESFASDTPFKLKVEGEAATACEGARRSLLGNGYLIEKAADDQVKARKARKDADDLNTFIEINVVCAGDNVGSTMYANGVLSTYDLKKSSSSASVGVSALGSISLPIGQSADSLVKIGEETIDDAEFYRRFFAAVQQTLSEMQVRSTPEEPITGAPAAPPTAPVQPSTPDVVAQPATPALAPQPAGTPVTPPAQQPATAAVPPMQPATQPVSVQAAPEPAAQPISIEPTLPAAATPTATAEPLPSDLPPELMPAEAASAQTGAATPAASAISPGLIEEAFPSPGAAQSAPAQSDTASRPAPPVIMSVQGSSAAEPAPSGAPAMAPQPAPAITTPAPVVLPEPSAPLPR